MNKPKLNIKKYEITFPDGHTEEIENLAEFCRNHDLDRSYMARVARQGRNHHKNYKVKIIEHNGLPIPKILKEKQET